MAISKPLQSNFAAGELSPRIRASADLERYAAGLDRAENLLILPLGAAQRRGGSVWAVDPPDPTKLGRLLPFQRALDDAVAVVVQDEALTFVDVATRAYLVDELDAVIEVACPWGDADYAHLFVWQSADVLWIGDRRGTRAVQVLQRVGGAWQALEPLALRWGPFLPDQALNLTLTFSAVTGTGVTCTASAAAFEAAHVGALIYFREAAPPYKRWTAGEAMNIDPAERVRFNAGRIYQGGIGTTGNNSPIHDEGSVTDGGVIWEFLHDGSGYAEITGFTDDDEVTVTIHGRLPQLATSEINASRWAFGAFSDVEGWPRAGVVHHERMVLGGARSTPDTTYLGRVSAYGPTYADFKPGLGTGLVIDSDAVRRALNSGEVQQIVHYVSFERLYAFTTESVHVLSGPSVDEPITPAGAAARERSFHGAAPEVGPVKSGDSILFVTPGRQELRELVRDTLETPNLSILANHIADRCFAELAYLKAPFPHCYARLDDGGLAAMTHERLENVQAWARQVLGGAAKAESVIPLRKADGRHELWAYVRREIDGATRYAIEVLQPAWNEKREPLEQACCLDAAGYFDFWNTDADNRARLTVLDAGERAAEVETEENSFTSGDVGRRLALRLAAPENGFDPGDRAAIARVDVLEFVDAKTVRGRLVSDGHEDLADAWTLHWAKMESTLTVGARLEGCAVDVLGDAHAQLDLSVVDGDVVLEEPVARGWVGLRAAFELVDLPVAQGSAYGTALGGAKKVEKLWVIAENPTPGVVVFNPLTGAEETLVWRSVDDPSDRPPVQPTGYYSQLPQGAWSETGQIGVRQAAPYPLTVLGIVKEIVT